MSAPTLLTDTFCEKHLFYMVMEKCDGSLMDYLAKTSTMAEAELLNIFVAMLRGIQHVHSVGIVHRDIKPDNFLLSGAAVKLCDFGLAAKMPARGVLTGVYGTAPYMSPEMLAHRGYDHLTDVWSFGATAFLMIHGRFPYSPKQSTAAAMKSAILTGRPAIKFVRPPDKEPLFRRAFLDRATPFLQALLQRTSATRRSAAEALKLPFLILEREVAQKMTISETTMPLAPAIRKAHAVVKRPADPTVQRNLDELLQRLQLRRGTSSGSSSPASFSEEVGDEEPCDERVGRRSTHPGVVAPGAADAKGWHGLGVEDLHDAASTATPGSRSESSRSAGSGPVFGDGHLKASTVPGPA